VLSPLLANIALHGLEATIRASFPRTARRQGKVAPGWTPIVIRYADDFVILHEDRGVIETAQQVTADWLTGLGLELKPSKTRITHTLTRTEEGNVGFDFLGWNIRQHPVGKYHTGKNTTGQPLGFKTIITPSKEARKRHQAALATIVNTGKADTQDRLILRLNRLTHGWVNYHATGVAKKAFSHMQRLLFRKLWHWARRRHPHKSANWVAKKYWHLDGVRKWDFHVREGPRLYQHTEKAIMRHVKVEGTKTPFDGDWVYWATRLGRHPDLHAEVAYLLRKQHGRCTWCGLYFTNADLRESDHIIPKRRRLKVGWSEKQLLHGHCHDSKTAQDGSYARGTGDNEPETEEPDA